MERRVECRASLHRTESGWVIGYNEHSVFVPLGLEQVELPGSPFVFELVDRRGGDVASNFPHCCLRLAMRSGLCSRLRAGVAAQCACSLLGDGLAARNILGLFFLGAADQH